MMEAFFDRLFRSRIVNFDGMEIPGPKSLPLIGNVFDVDLRGLHLSLSKMPEQYGSIFRIKLLGQNIVIINDADLERKAFGNTRYGDVFNDRPDTFVGQYFCFNYSDITFANANKKTMTKRKLFHRSLKFYGDGIKHFDGINENELVKVLEKLKLTKQCDFDMYSLLLTSLANTLVGLLNGTSPTKTTVKL